MSAKQKFASLGSGLALTILVAGPAVSDDTEILVTTAASTDKPNVLFILDTSGSMNTLEHTVGFYDSATSYGGSCDASNLYWSDSGLLPTCDAERAVAKADFVCTAADKQIDGIGSYTGIVAQFRTGTGTGDKWQDLAKSEFGALVECAEDSGIHGDGTAGDVYAKSGTGGSPFTSNPAEEINWDSYPTNITYTLYDGNYLNYKANPGEADLKRIDIVKTVLKKVLSAYKEVNLALMRFNNNDGGPVIHAMQDLDASRTTLETTLDAITAVGNTPLSETFYEAALYWQGLPAHYGENVNEHPTDPNALAVLEPEIYAPPPEVAGACSRNYNILLTDGLPKNDADTELLAPTLPGWSDALGRTTCDDYLEDGDCLDDVSEYLFKHDISSSPGRQFARTFAVGFLTPQDTMARMRETAEIAEGKFFITEDPEELTVALLKIFDEIVEQSLSFTSPAVAVNAFNRTRNLNDLYMTVFESANSVRWPGNVKKYKIVNSVITDANGNPAVDLTTGFFRDSAQSYWTTGGPDGAEVTLGGAANVLPAPALRKLYTNNGSSDLTAGINALKASNATAFTVADFGLTGSNDEPSIEEIIRWANGEDVADEDGDPATTTRNAMGDPLHAQPAAIDYGSGGSTDVVVYSATNDGYLHAIDGDTGVELWSFVPKELMTNFAKLYNNPVQQFKSYGIDGDIAPIVFDENGNGEIEGNDFIYLIFGLRRGGNRYYALDVTNKNAPKLLWNVSYAGFGQTWSRPVITRVNTTAAGLNAEKAVVVIGAGYDTAHDSPAAPGQNDGEGAGIFMLDLKSGATIWRAAIDTNISADFRSAEMTRAFPSAIKVIDINGDRFADRMYAADVGGQIWRFDIVSGQPPASLVAGGVIARFGFEGVSAPGTEGPRRIYNSPDVSVFTDPLQNRMYGAISIGTGYRAHPLNTNAVDRFYSLRDPDVFKQLLQSDYDNYDVATDADMVEVSGQTKTVLDSQDRGWRFTLPARQMVLADSTTFDDSVFFVSFSPDVTSDTTCDLTVGRNYLYRVSITNGDPIVTNIDTLDPAVSDDERRTELKQGGIAPSPTVLFPSPDPNCTGAACDPPPIYCVGVECDDPGFENVPVRTLWTQDGVQ